MHQYAPAQDVPYLAAPFLFRSLSYNVPTLRIADFNSGRRYQAVGETVLRRGLHSRRFQRMDQADEYQKTGEMLEASYNDPKNERRVGECRVFTLYPLGMP